MFNYDWLTSVLNAVPNTYQYDDVAPPRVAARIHALRDTIGANVEEIGRSRSNAHPLLGVVVGAPDRPTITLTGNCHAEEVVGTLTILWMLEQLRESGVLAPLRERVRFVTIPQMNPDGVLNNWRWIAQPTPKNRLAFCWRDHRAEDVEHGIAEDGEEFRRPEPAALAAFYAREAAKRTAFYATLHSSHMEAGAYFLTGNETEGAMAQAWSLIREFAEPIAALPLYSEDCKGFQHFRKISDGVYNVPRRGEMQQAMQGSGMAVAKGFRTNSLEWMEQRGTALSFVSEVPTITARAFIQKPIPGLPALALVAPVVPLLQQASQERSALLTALTTTLLSHVADTRRLQWATEEFSGGRNRKPEQFASFLHAFVGRTALRHHEARLAAHPAIDQVKLAGLAVAVLDDCAERREWEDRLATAYVTLNTTLGLSMTPIVAQMRLQILLILAGMAAALPRERLVEQ